MHVKADIQNREDLVLLLTSFYEKVFRDELIGHFFTEVMHVNLETHIPRIADFWETVLLGGRNYKDNAIAPHMKINQLSPIEEQHFKRWLSLFHETIDEMFQGDIAELAKQRAVSVATVMRIKIANTSSTNIIKG
jgi:hemoglobin